MVKKVKVRFNFEEVVFSEMSCSKFTFKELTQLENVDILSESIYFMDALHICKNSCAAPLDIYQLWVNKLLKIYDITKFSNDDCQCLVKYLTAVLNQISVNELIITVEYFDVWTTYTLDFLKWLNNIIIKLNVHIFNSMICFILDVYKTFLKSLNKRHLNNLDILEQHILLLIKSYLCHVKVESERIFKDMTTVLLSLCELSLLLSKFDIKATLVTWDSVAKFTVTLFGWYKNFDLIVRKSIGMDWLDKPIECFFNELLKVLKYIIAEDPINNGENFLKLILFYIQNLKLIINCNDQTNFSNLKIFFEIYVVYKHSTQFNTKHAVIDSVNNEFLELFSKMYYRENVGQFIMHHLSANNCDLDNNCPIIFDYLSLCAKNHQKRPDVLEGNVENICNMYKQRFQEFVKIQKNYSMNLECFTAILLIDNTFTFHKFLCELLLQTDNFNLALSVCDTLRIFYCYNLERFGMKYCWPFIKFWLNSLEKYSANNFLIRWHLLYNVIQNYDKSSVGWIQEKLQQQKPPQEILLLKSIEKNSYLFVLYSKLIDRFYRENFLHELKGHFQNLYELQIDKAAYSELNDKLQILTYYYPNDGLIKVCNDDIANIIELTEKFMEKIFHDFSYDRVIKFQLFFNNCFKLFYSAMEKYKMQKFIDYKLFTNYEQHARKISSVFMLNYLLILKQQQPTVKIFQTFFENLLTNDFKIVSDLLFTFQIPNIINNSINAKVSMDQRNNAYKRLRLNDCDEIEKLLNNLLIESEDLLLCKNQLQSMHDCKIRHIINNLEKCLSKK